MEMSRWILLTAAHLYFILSVIISHNICHCLFSSYVMGNGKNIGGQMEIPSLSTD